MGLWLALSGLSLFATDTLLKNARVFDETGKPPFSSDIRIHGDRIAAVAKPA